MRVSVLAAGLALALAQAAFAETIPVRSGNHADFARLVLGFDASAGWKLGRIDGGWEFRAADTGIDFDPSGVFNLIPHDRIAAVEAPAPGVLRILVSCDCHLDGFELRRSRVVIDVKDGAAPSGNPFEARLDGAAGPAEVPDLAEADPEPAALPAKSVEPPPPVVVPDELAAALREATRGSGAGGWAEANGPAPSPAEPDFATDIALASRSRAFEQMVLEQLARAGSQGLIVPAETPLPARAPNPDTKQQAEVTPMADGPALPVPADEVASSTDDHIRIETSVDRDGPSARPAEADLTEIGHICPARGRVDLTGWGHLRDGSPAIDEYRSGLTGEFDVVDPERALTLARYYVFLTFGAEARQMLQFVDPNDPDVPLISAMAEIVDQEGSAPVGLPLDGYESCDSEAALWAVLAGEPLRPGQEVNENVVLQTFGDLPAHAKTLLGPRLIAAFTGAGRLEAAAMLRNSLQLGATEHTVDAAVANAQLDEAMGAPHKAEERLDAALAETDPDAPLALLALAENQLDRGETLAPEMTEALEAFAYEQRGSDIAARLSLVLARAALARGAFAEARKMILTRLPPDTQATQKLLREVYVEAAASGDAESFLRLVLPRATGLAASAADRPARLAVAKRLLALGFADDTLALLGPGAAAGEDHEVRLLAARALLAGGDAGLAVAALAALDGAEPAGLMAEAQEQLGNIAEARKLYASVGRQADADRMAVLERDWEGLADATDPALRGLAERFAAGIEPAGPAAEPYDAAAKMIEDSARDRAALDAVLQSR